MRVMVLVEPRFPIPPEMFPTLLDGFAAWRDRYRENMESFEFFAGGGGGFGVINVPDEATLNRMMVEYPFTPFSEITVRPVLDGDTALEQWRDVMGQMRPYDTPQTGGIRDEVIMNLVDRARRDPEFRDRARTDLEGTLSAYGYELTEEELAAAKRFHQGTRRMTDAQLERELTKGARELTAAWGG